METLKTSLETVLTTIQKLPEKDALVIFLFVRNVVEAVEAYLASNQTFDIEALLSDCCIGFQQADDVIVERKDECIQVDTVLDEQVTNSYQLHKNKVTIVSKEDSPQNTEQTEGKDDPNYMYLPQGEGAEGEPDPTPQAQQTVLECSDPSVLQAFLEEGGKLPSYLPPGTQIIIETEDGRTEVLENTALDPQSMEQQKAIEAIQTGEGVEPPNEAGTAEMEPTEGGMDDGEGAGVVDDGEEAGDIPVFVMTEEGEMLVSSEQIENIPELKQQLQEAQAGEKRKAEDTGEDVDGLEEVKKIKLESWDDETEDADVYDGSAMKTNTGSYQCDRCFQCFTHEHSLHRHYRAQHLQMKWTCDTCGRDFTRADSLVNHKKKGSCFKGPGKKRMPVVGETFIKGEGYLCVVCDMYFKTAAQLRKHQDKCHNTENFACNDCGKWFQRSDLLEKHKEENLCVKDGATSLAAAGDKDLNTSADSGTAEEPHTPSFIKRLDQTSSRGTPRKPGSKQLDDLYLCQECGQCLTSKNALQIHMRKHTGIVPFKCQFCGHGTNSRANLIRHLDNIHGVTKDSPIVLDLRDYSKDESLDSSGPTNVSDSQAVTAVSIDPTALEDIFNSSSTIEVEQKLAEIAAILEVPADGSISSSNNNVDNSNEQHKSPDKTSIASSTRSNVNKMDDNKKATDKLIKKPVRGFLLEDLPTDLFNPPDHKGSRSGVPKEEPTCIMCFKKFHNHSNLTVHMRSHTKELPFKCDYCDKRFGTNANKTRHELTVHEGRRDWECDICHKRYSEKKTLINHKKTAHDGERPFECDVCHKTFTQKCGLNSHMIQHAGKIPDQECTLCDRKFLTEGQLRYHVKQHKETDTVCDFCDLSFVNNTDYRRHMRTVHNETQDMVTCELCLEKFKTKEEFTAHINAKHTKSKGYSCSICEGVSFYSSKSLDKHMQKFHPEGGLDDDYGDESSLNDNSIQNSTIKSETTYDTSNQNDDSKIESEESSSATPKAFAVATPRFTRTTTKSPKKNENNIGSQQESAVDTADEETKKGTKQKENEPKKVMMKFPRVVLPTKRDKASLVVSGGDVAKKQKLMIVKTDGSEKS